MKRLESCFSCEFLGDQLFGYDVDLLFTYPAAKTVLIRDRTLGLTKLVLSLAIFCYIVLYELAYKGSHFESQEVEGVYRLQWQHPVKDNCNPADVDCLADYTPRHKLPYCSAFGGKTKSPLAQLCEYYDATELPLQLFPGVMIPTFVRSFKQRRLCSNQQSSDQQQSRCDLKWEYVDEHNEPQRGSGEAKPIHEAYVADVEDFTMLIDHAFQVKPASSTQSSTQYDDFYMQGSFVQCSDGHVNCTTSMNKCMHDEGGCAGRQTKEEESEGEAKEGHSGVAAMAVNARLRPKHQLRAGLGHARQSESGGGVMSHDGTVAMRVRGGQAATEPTEPWEAEPVDGEEEVSHVPEVISIKTGDVMSVRTLLALARRSLDHIWYDDDQHPMSIRSRGAVIVIHIRYNNWVPWTIIHLQDPPTYQIEVVARPVYKFKHGYVASESEEFRILNIAYGIQIIVQQSGDMYLFSPVHALVILTAAMGLMAAANTFTNMLALHVLPSRQEYKNAMFEETHDFHTVADEKAKKVEEEG